MFAPPGAELSKSRSRLKRFVIRWGPVFLTTAMLVALNRLEPTPFRVPNPALPCVAAIVFATFLGGLAPGLVSALLSIGYLVLFFSDSVWPLEFSPDNLRRTIVLIVSIPVITMLVGLLKRRDQRRTRIEAEARALQGFHDLVHGLDAIIWEADARTGRFTFVNRRAEDLLGYPVGRWLAEPDLWEGLLHPEDRERAIEQRRAVAQEGRDRIFEYRLLAADGRTVWMRDHLRVVVDASGSARLGGLMLDVSEGKRSEEALRSREEQVRLSQKMDAIGRLAGGVAHDFNNLLTVILGHSEQMLAGLTPRDPEFRGADEIRRAAERAADLTHQLLAFSRRQVLEPVVLDLNSVTADMHSMLRRLIGEHIELRTVRGDHLGSVLADRSQIEQVILNLAINARDAMPGGGQLTIETADVERAPSSTRGPNAVVPGAYVMLAVSDSGTGMPPDVALRVFEPFFTTKASGKGTGLGLATVYGIVKQSGGYVWVYSEPGHGTTFKIYLPRVDGEVGREAATPAGAARGNEVVLLVEDDEEVRALLSQALLQRGYTVLEAENGEGALAVAESHPDSIHLLITDVVMPRMGGGEVAERLGARRRGIRVLFISGYTDDAIVHQGVLDAGLAFLQKPFTPEGLARKVREVLDAAVRV